MRRLSPITLALAGLTIVVFATAIYVIWRPQQGTPAEVPSALSFPTGPIPPPAAPPPSAAVRPPLSRPRPPTAVPAPLPAPPPTVMAVLAPPVRDAAVSADGPAGGGTLPDLLVRRRALATAERPKVLAQADETAFEALKLPESTRAAVRQINEEHRRRTQELLAARDGGATPMSSIETARREAIDSLLGEAAAKDFHAAEFSAARRLRRQTRQPPGAPGDPPGTPPGVAAVEVPPPADPATTPGTSATSPSATPPAARPPATPQSGGAAPPPPPEGVGLPDVD